jgi:DNA-binding transcriptional ArsR family regulator
VLTTVLEAFGNYDRGAPAAWLEEVRGALAGHDLAPLVEVMRVPPERLLPDFVIPMPTGPLTTLADDVALLAATAPERVHGEIEAEYGGAPPAVFAAFLRRPEREVARLAAAAQTVWDAVFAHRWDEMRAILERDVVAQLHILTVEGIEAMLARIHHRIHFEDDSQIAARLFGEGRTLGERTLWLEPMICGPDALRHQLASPECAEISYAARGVEQFWGVPEPEAGAPLRALLGAPRARVAAAIHEPDTTTHLAGALGLSKATVNYHLGALVEAGIADRARFGRSVFYMLTARGRTLVHEFGDGPSG